jgi:O-antigen/teichoic acid export membrane protein
MSALDAPPGELQARSQPPDSIARNAAFSFAAQLTTASLTAVLTIFLVRTLGPHDYGVFALALGVGAIALAIADFGISNSTARFVAEHRERRAGLGALVADGLKLKFLVAGCVCLLLALAAEPIASAYGEPALVWPLRGIAIATFGQTVVLMLLTISTALGRTAVNMRLVAAESLVEVSASIALVLLGAGAAGAAFGRAIGYASGAMLGVVVVLRLTGARSLRLRRPPDRATVRRVGGYAGGLFVIDAAHIVSSNVGVLLLGAFLGPVASGTFQAPAKLITFLQYVGLSTANGVAPRLARGAGKDPDVRAMQAGLRALIGFQCLLLAPTVVWAGPIASLVLGSGYADSADVLVALAPFIFFSGLMPLLSNGVNYLGEARRRIPISIVTLVVTVGGGLILIPRYGLVGAAVTTDVAYGFYTLAHLWLCHRLLRLRLDLVARSLACGLAAAGAMAIVLAQAGTERLAPLDWLLGGAAGLAAYASVLVLARELRPAAAARWAASLRGQATAARRRA